jgi:hypothetical protein
MFNQEMLSNLVKKTKQTYVLPILAKFVFVIISFNVWMSKGAHDVFALVVNFLRENCMPKHIMISLFKTSKTSK